ncbi:HD-GYP domain-containing protein [Metapseudomonas otitidis]|uniref:HD-GYP domain-containing protein n=1 Tax=Metapseudomonas otitidis TaxID=319939 RepID=UPI001F32EAC1|nr:two-component system response regulator [Pseudomonas otitidis]
MLKLMDPDSKPTLLVVDDTPENLSLLSALLSPHYLVKVAINGQRALDILASDTRVDLILLDVVMPDMDGYQVMQALQDIPQARGVPVIFLTAQVEESAEAHGLALGAVDYIHKPITPAIVLARVRNHLELKAARDLLYNQNAYLEQEVERRTRENELIQNITIHSLASLAETRDNETGNHILRTQYYVKLLAEELSDHPRFQDELTPKTIELLFKSAPLHDIGKVGVPDRILLKPGKLEPEEFAQMKNHPVLGKEAIVHAEEALGVEVEFLRLAKEIACYHHEKWDGSGYPHGLAGDDIPLSARLMALADVYDALISKRCYKAALPHDEVVPIILAGRGNHFDPDITDAFARIHPQFQEIARRFHDD